MDLSKLQKNRWASLILSILSGLLLSLSWYWPFTVLSFVALVPLLLLERFVDQKSNKYPTFTFWAYSYISMSIWNIGVYWWLWNASGVATLGAWFANGLLQTLPLVFYQVTKRTSADKFSGFAFVAGWLAFEYLHLHWELSWVWLNLGNLFGQTPFWVQWYEYTGTFGGTLWVLLVNLLVFNTLVSNRGKLRLVMAVLVPFFWSAYLWNTYQTKGEQMEMLMVQPNLDCYAEKFDYNARTGQRNTQTHVPYAKQVERFIRLTDENITPQTRWIAWPETSLHKGFIEGEELNYPDILKVYQWMREKHKDQSLLTGADTYKIYESETESPTSRYREGIGYYDVCNSALMINDQQKMEIYNKSQLVIGVEAIPFKSILKPIMLNLGGSTGGLGRQQEREVFFDSEQVGVAPVICYESVYGEFVTQYVQEGAQVLSVITNDGWWGNTPGHTQHLYFSQLRAIENRRDVVRAANTGISCFINQKGEMLSYLPYGVEGALLGKVNLNKELTFYARYGDYLGRLAAFLAPLMLLAAVVKSRLLKPEKRR